MALTNRQRMLLHLIVRRYDRESRLTYLDPVLLEEEMGAPLPELAADIDALEEAGYVERPPAAPDTAGSDSWVLAPTDRGVLSAMGLE
ncbi:MAG: hypothetical protein Kow00122_18970 [Thermoleophilia bacterium]|nr:hypothetical protein [Actinomycetota bacterium]